MISMVFILHNVMVLSESVSSMGTFLPWSIQQHVRLNSNQYIHLYL